LLEGTDKEHNRYEVSAAVRIGDRKDKFFGNIDLYWYDERGAELRELPLQLEASRNYALQGSLPLKTGAVDVILNDISLMGDMRGYPFGKESYISLMIDRNGNGFFDSRGEEFDTRSAFTIDGVTYRIFDMSPSGGTFTIREVDEDVPEIQPSPNLNKGRIIPSFVATTIDGKEVRFPQDFEDKLIFFDIWATWCGPCIAETPFQKQAFGAFHDRGIVFISLSIDTPERLEKLKDYIRDNDLMHDNWLHINDPGGWRGELFGAFATTGIPACFLIDGATGKILTGESESRGESLMQAINSLLPER
jgi:thiol-disulfide isomerase/thioredoxin